MTPQRGMPPGVHILVWSPVLNSDWPSDPLSTSRMLQKWICIILSTGQGKLSNFHLALLDCSYMLRPLSSLLTCSLWGQPATMQKVQLSWDHHVVNKPKLSTMKRECGERVMAKQSPAVPAILIPAPDKWVNRPSQVTLPGKLQLTPARDAVCNGTGHSS